MRPVMKRDKQVLLHWGYFPDRSVLSLQRIENHPKRYSELKTVATSYWGSITQFQHCREDLLNSCFLEAPIAFKLKLHIGLAETFSQAQTCNLSPALTFDLAPLTI